MEFSSTSKLRKHYRSNWNDNFSQFLQDFASRNQDATIWSETLFRTKHNKIIKFQRPMFFVSNFFSTTFGFCVKRILIDNQVNSISISPPRKNSDENAFFSTKKTSSNSNQAAKHFCQTRWNPPINLFGLFCFNLVKLSEQCYAKFFLRGEIKY